MPVSLTTKAHHFILEHLNNGDIAIDATAGNGHDTIFLSRRVGANGKVFGFDVQKQAIDSTLLKIDQEKKDGLTKLFHACHSKMEDYIPKEYHGKIKTIMFNLGYLPGSDKSIITLANTTLIALNQSINLIAPAGIITITAYPGHAGGGNETNLVKQWCGQLNVEDYTNTIICSSEKEAAPILFIVKKKG